MCSDSWGRKKHINKVPPKPGQSRENFVYVFFCLCVFSLSKESSEKPKKGLGCLNRPQDMGYRSNSIAISRDMGPLYSGRFLAERIFCGFLFLGRRIFSRIFSPDFFSSFCWKKCPEKSSRKIPGKILQNLYNKNPRHISAEGPAQTIRYRSDSSLIQHPQKGVLREGFSVP